MFNLLKSFDKLKVQYARNCGAKRAYCLHFRNSARRMKLHALSYDAIRRDAQDWKRALFSRVCGRLLH